ncbi:hypothetical protein VUJ46_18315 [Chryseobacterium sp. MYb264]|uniref:helix-turn-helix domain-containing protein n=1 Tax=Chryseobacterium sp. MYb264 TaxID=2745153 RepID=UPI002E133130|nr:hypothetical protein VUJ46_18315 [Chryseobacterium sp. MYb264]
MKGITLGSLAKDIQTNSSYVSEVINTYKEQNFASYLNSLRVEYLLNKLVTDKKFRSYKLGVIPDELGYNNEQAFSIEFKKRQEPRCPLISKKSKKHKINKRELDEKNLLKSWKREVGGF